MNHLKGRDFLRSELSFLSPKQTVFDAYAQMIKSRVHHLPVIENGKAVGIISDRDLQFVKDFGQNDEILCQDIMTSDPYVSSVETSISDICEEMVSRRINSALISDEKNQIVGIFTSTDALKILAAGSK